MNPQLNQANTARTSPADPYSAAPAEAYGQLRSLAASNPLILPSINLATPGEILNINPLIDLFQDNPAAINNLASLLGSYNPKSQPKPIHLAQLLDLALENRLPDHANDANHANHANQASPNHTKDTLASFLAELATTTSEPRIIEAVCLSAVRAIKANNQGLSILTKMLIESPEANAADADTDPPKIRALACVATRFYELVPHIDISLLDLRTITVVVNSSTEPQQDLQRLFEAAKEGATLPSAEFLKEFYKLCKYIPEVAALRVKHTPDGNVLLELASMRTPLPQLYRKSLADRLGKFSKDIRNDLIAVLERYLETITPLESFYEILRVAPTTSQINLGTHLDIPVSLFKDCLTALKNSTEQKLEPTAHLVTRLRLISESEQARVIEKLTSSGIDQADRTLSEIITKTHPSAGNSRYSALNFKYSGIYSAPESSLARDIFNDSLLTYALTNQRGEGYRSLSDLLLRRELAIILNSSPENRETLSFTYSLLALTRELYYRETWIYPSDSEMLGVIMLCDPRSQQITPKNRAKLVTGYTACNNKTEVMLALIAAFKATAQGVRQIDIFVGDTPTAEEYSHRHYYFFSSLGIKSDNRQDGTLKATPRVAFTTLDKVTLEAAKAARDAPGAMQVTDRIALIDGSSLSLAGGLIKPINVSPTPPKSLVHQAQFYILSCETPAIDEFLQFYPAFNSLPRKVIHLCLSIAPKILPKNGKPPQGTENLYPTDVISKYSAILNLTTSSKAPGHESIFDEIFGESRLELMLPDDAQFTQADGYSIRFTDSDSQRMDAVIKRASAALSKEELLLIVTDKPESISRSLNMGGIPNIHLEEGAQEAPSRCTIFVCSPNYRAVFDLNTPASQNIDTPDFQLVVLIASNIRTPEELEDLRQIGPRSGVKAETIHLISLEDYNYRTDIRNLIANIVKNSPNPSESRTLKGCINFIRDAESILSYTPTTLRPGCIKVIREALRSYEKRGQLVLNSLSNLPGLADTIFNSLYNQNIFNMRRGKSYIDIPEFAGVEFLDSQRYRELAELCDAFERHFSKTIQEIFRALDADRERTEDNFSEYYEDGTDLSPPPGEAPSHQQQIEYGHLTSLFLYYAHKIAVSKQAVAEISEDAVWGLLNG